MDSQIQDVSKILGSAQVINGDLSDQRFDAVDLLTIIQRVETIIQHIHPSAIYTHHPSDLNLDHALTARAVLTATRPTKPGCIVKDVYYFEVPSSTEWGFNYQFQPNVFMDITTTLNLKLKAMACYASETRPFPHPRSPDMLTAIAARWGSVAVVGSAEAFELVRSLR